jgi:catechol 2,3-dioxygenase-like lactoylglutathione lyase family enzyme
MAAGEAAKLVAFAAVFAVTDVDASCAFYVHRLDFRVHFQMGDPISCAIVERDAVSMHLMPASQDTTIGRSSIYVFTADVDALHDELRTNGCVIEVPPTDFLRSAQRRPDLPARGGSTAKTLTEWRTRYASPGSGRGRQAQLAG